VNVTDDVDGSRHWLEVGLIDEDLLHFVAQTLYQFLLQRLLILDLLDHFAYVHSLF
jgi:hypothetical protein